MLMFIAAVILTYILCSISSWNLLYNHFKKEEKEHITRGTRNFCVLLSIFGPVSLLVTIVVLMISDDRPIK